MTYHMEREDIQSILTYLQLPLSESLPCHPLKFLDKHISSLPASLTAKFDFIPPRQRSRIPAIKHRRLLHATSVPRPTFLTASEGRLRWPLLWEKMGGDPLFTEPSSNVEEEEDWVREGFMKDVESSQQVKKLGGFLRILEEEREAEDVRAAKRMERGLETEGEEFDEESDEEEDVDGDSQRGQSGNAVNGGSVIAEDQADVARMFEKRILELYLDGLDTIDYTMIDFSEPEGGDPIAIRDEEDRYFDDEEPSRTPGGHVQGQRATPNPGDEKKNEQNGQGEYDY